jgi:hypothetical protein
MPFALTLTTSITGPKHPKFNIVRGGLSGNLSVLCRRVFPGAGDNGLKFPVRVDGERP